MMLSEACTQGLILPLRDSIDTLLSCVQSLLLITVTPTALKFKIKAAL